MAGLIGIGVGILVGVLMISAVYRHYSRPIDDPQRRRSSSLSSVIAEVNSMLMPNQARAEQLDKLKDEGDGEEDEGEGEPKYRLPPMIPSNRRD